MKNKKVFLTLMFVAFLSQLCSAQIVDAELIHWNDFHSANISYTPIHNNPNKIQVGGSANLAGYIDSLRNIYQDVLVVNAGDDFQGSPVSSITKGLSQILILNKIHPDAFTLGNHEFDYGTEKLYNSISKANFPIVSSNIFDKSKNELFTEPYHLYKKGNIDIAVIGVVFEDLKSSVLPANVADLKILNPVNEIKKYVNEVKDKTDLIIVLSHSGFYEDSLMAENLEDVDIIVGGHSHSWISKPIKVNDIIILQAGARGERLGFLKMKIDKDKNIIKSYDYDFIRTETGKVKPNLEVLALVDSLESKIRLLMDTEIGVLEKDWIRNSHDESNIGNWICDATKTHFDVDIVFQNSGGIRKNLPAGPIKIRDIWEISPFDNTIQIIELTGKEIIDLINYRIKNPRDLLQISGIKIYMDYKNKTLSKVTIANKTLDLEKKYSIATNNYTMSHSQRFFGIDNSTLEIDDTKILGRDVLLEAVKKQKIIKGDIENRIIDINQ